MLIEAGTDEGTLRKLTPLPSEACEVVELVVVDDPDDFLNGCVRVSCTLSLLLLALDVAHHEMR